MMYKQVLAIIETAIKERKKVSQVCKERELPSQYVSKYIYDVKNGRVSLPQHSADRLLIRYNQAMSSELEFDDSDLSKAKAFITKKRGEAVSITEFANHVDKSPANAVRLLEIVKHDGYSLMVKEPTNQKTVVFQDEPRETKNLGETHLFGVLGDTHLGSKYAREDLLKATYERFAELGVKTVFHTGNWIDGEARFNTTDLLVHGMDNQIQYMIEHYPKVEGITTYYIAGDDHEGWYTQKVGINIGKYLEIKAQEAGRHDLVFLGYMEADVMLGKTKVRVLHPGGGSAYAISYTSQKIVESYNEKDKPDILLHGHYHKFEYLYLRDIHVFQTGCLEEQTPFMRKKRLSAHLGAWVLEFTPNEEGRIVEMVQRPIVYPASSWEYKH